MTTSIAIQGICYDAGSSFLRGPALAPPLIRQTLHDGSSNAWSENGYPTTGEHIIDKGDFRISRYEQITDITRRHLQEGHRLLTLGGDHSISYPVLQAYSGHYEGIHILQIDAHADLYENYEGDRHSHACPFARIMEGRHASRLVQLGIRAHSPYLREQARKLGVEVYEMKDWSFDRMPRFDRPVYLSLDMDGFDPAFAPGVSHHEPGGFSSREVIRIIQSLDVPLIGADIVEFNPMRDPTGITAALAAKMMKEILGKMQEK